MRTTPWRLITLQCSQIGLTLLRTFTCISYGRAKSPARGIRRISELAFENTEPPEASQLGGVPKLAAARIAHLWGSVSAYPLFARDSDSKDRIDSLHRLARIWCGSDRSSNHKVRTAGFGSLRRCHDPRLIAGRIAGQTDSRNEKLQR